MSYRDTIRELLAKNGDNHICAGCAEGALRCEHNGVLDHLSREQIAAELEWIVMDIEDAPKTARDLAECYGIEEHDENCEGGLY